MPHEQLPLTTRDGLCPTHVFTPAGSAQDAGTGPWPGVIFYGDAGGIRPAMLAMGQRLADFGYVVLLPDLYYRHGPYAPLVPVEVFKGDVRAILGPLMATTDNLRAAADTEAWLACLAARADVVPGPVGAVGFCMGGGMALTAAGVHGDRFAAVASFHGGRLATEADTSPHRHVAGLRAEVYLGVADNDDSYPPEMAARFERALTDAGVRHASETYTGAAHGWMVPDFPVFDAVAAERGWTALGALFARRWRG